jgi:hypothetical protein
MPACGEQSFRSGIPCGSTWATDANQIDIVDLERVLFRVLRGYENDNRVIRGLAVAR